MVVGCCGKSRFLNLGRGFKDFIVFYPEKLTNIFEMG